MLSIYFLSFSVLLALACCAPLEPLEYSRSDVFFLGPFHGPHTATGSANTEPTTTYRIETEIDAATTTYAEGPSATDEDDQFYVQTTVPTGYVEGPSATDEGDQFYAQTTMPAAGAIRTGAATTSTGARAQATTGVPRTGRCPATKTGTTKCYRYASDFPPKSAWLSLECLISHARPDMITTSNDGPSEADIAIAAVKSGASQAELDPRIAFAVMMQESSGKVRPIIGDAGKSYGLFQVQRPGVPLCDKYAKNQCPKSVIVSQVQFGIYGHSGASTAPQAPGLAYWISAQGGNVGRALRGYNTGSVPNPNDLTDATATRQYVSDVANRLVGGMLGAQHKNTCPGV